MINGINISILILIVILGIVQFLQGLEMDLIIKEVREMAHDKVYATCENMCLEETMTKAQIQEALNNIQVKDGDVTTAKLADGAVTNSKIANGAVGESNISNGAVTNSKLAPYSVGTSNLIMHAITNDKLANDAVSVKGTYTGNGSTSRTIEVGFEPTLVIVQGSELTDDEADVHELLCICINEYGFNINVAGDNMDQYYIRTSNSVQVGTSMTGFEVNNIANLSGCTYMYVAFR